MTMKVGYQTIIWGRQIENLEAVLDVIANCGYQGVEIAQRPEDLGVESMQELLDLLKTRDLKLVGLAGGTLKERMEFCEGIPPEEWPEYFYIEKWDDEFAPIAIDKGFTLALHPHLFTPIQRLDKALELLNAHPDLKFLPDTAHLYIAGDNPVEALRKIDTERIASVHLKQWRPKYGRSSHRYARGFIELSNREGIIDLEGILKELERIDYDGWLIAEQDSSHDEPTDRVVASAKWLVQQELLPDRSDWPKSTSPSDLVLPTQMQKRFPEELSRFTTDIMRTCTEGVDTCYDEIASAFVHLIPCDVVTVWTYNPASDLMSLLGISPKLTAEIETCTLECGKVLSGQTVEQKTVVKFNLTEESNAQRFGHPQMLQAKHLKRMVSIPIFNSWNFNHVRLLVNLFPSEEEIRFSNAELLHLGRYVAIATDLVLTDHCSSAVASANYLSGISETVEDLLEALKDLILRRLDCEAVSIFLVNDVGDKLELAAHTNTVWRVPEEEQFYQIGEGLTGQVWKTNNPLLTQNAKRESGRLGKAVEIVESDYDCCLIAPLRNFKGDVVGVVRCQNKRGTHLGIYNMFSDDDVAVLEAISQAIFPRLEVLQSQERRVKALGRMTHEMKVPIVAIRGAAQHMLRTKGVHKFFKFDYPGDVQSWSELMRRLIGNADVFRSAEQGHGIPINITSPVRLRGEVIAPSVRQVKALLRERGFSEERIEYGDFAQIPPLWVDKNLFQQVMFNLLSNAIKYCFEDAEAFDVVIDGDENDEAFVIYFEDWGPGIPRNVREAIFGEGFRGRDATEKDVAGQGLGLWVVRQIIQAHGGTIRVTGTIRPTQFTIRLPKSLRHSPPE